MPNKTLKTTKKRVYFGKNHIKIEDSKVVDKVFYDPETNTLDAEFTSGKRYRYRGVKPKLFAQFVLSNSLGRFFNTKIRKQFQYQPVK